MTLQQLEYFLAALEHGSFSGAAESLHLAQPSVSEQIRRLEGELGVRLFERVGRGLVPTEAGQTLRAHAERTLAAAREARESVVAVRELRGGTATFGMFGGGRFYPIAGLVADFRRRYPGVKIRLVGTNSSEVADEIRDGHLEAGMIALPIDDRGLDVRPLLRDELVYVSREPDAVRAPKTIEDIGARPLALFDASYGNADPMRRQLSELAQREGRRLEPDIEIEDAEAALDLAARGLADTILSVGTIHGLGRRMPKKLPWVPFAEPLYDTLALVSRAGGALSPASREFLRLAEARLSEFAKELSHSSLRSSS
jgi:DNA-binding transcriptional LysR family regulator